MSEVTHWSEWITGACFLLGSFLFLASSIGLLRLPDFYVRMHSPTKAATLGLMFLALGSLVSNLREGTAAWLEDLLLITFVFFTNPLSAQMLMRAAIASGVRQMPGTSGKPPSREVEHVGKAEPVPRSDKEG